MNIRLLNGELYLACEYFITIVGIHIKSISRWISEERQVIKDPLDKRRSLIRYSTLAQKYKDKIHAALGVDDIHDYTRYQQVQQLTETNTEEWKGFTSVYTTKKATELLMLCSMFRLLDRYRKRKEIRSLGLGISTRKEWISLVFRVATAELKYTKINNQRVFIRRARRYQEEGWRSLLHKGAGNSNSKKITKEVQDKLIALASSPNKPPLTVVASLYNRAAKVELHESTIVKFLERPEIMAIWRTSRHGNSFYNNYYQGII